MGGVGVVRRGGRACRRCVGGGVIIGTLVGGGGVCGCVCDVVVAHIESGGVCASDHGAAAVLALPLLLLLVSKGGGVWSLLLLLPLVS